MSQKNKTITVRLGEFEKQKLAQDIKASGFSKGRERNTSSNSKAIRIPTQSDYMRWLILNGQRPIHRDHYAQILRVNRNLIKIGGLFNQYLRHSNRELKILNDKGIDDENNRGFIKRFDHLEKIIFEIYDDLKLMNSILHETAKIEGA